MMRCPACGARGLLQIFSTYGLCAPCRRKELPRIQRRRKTIAQSLRYLEKTRAIKTILKRCDLVLENAQALLPLEQKGIAIFDPPPSQLLDACRRRKRDAVEVVVLEALGKAKAAATPARKLAGARLALEKIRLYRDVLRDKRFFDVLEREVERFMHETELQTFLDEGRKAEALDRKDEAIRAYEEALYFLRHDAIDDTRQSELIDGLERAIRSLQKP